MNVCVSRLGARLLAAAAVALGFGWGNQPVKADYPNVPVQRDQSGYYYPLRLFHDPGQKSRVSKAPVADNARGAGGLRGPPDAEPTRTGDTAEETSRSGSH